LIVNTPPLLPAVASSLSSPLGLSPALKEIATTSLASNGKKVKSQATHIIMNE
jgi:hypothetical protein